MAIQMNWQIYWGPRCLYCCWKRDVYTVVGRERERLCPYVKWWKWLNGTGPVQCYLCISPYNIVTTRVRERESEREAMSICEMVKWCWACTVLSLYFSLWHSYNKRERERPEMVQCPYFSTPDMHIPYQYEIAYFSVQHPVVYAWVGGRSAMFGVMILKASMLDWLG